MSGSWFRIKLSKTKSFSRTVRLDGAIDDLEAIRNTPVAARGRTLKLGDIAEVKRGYEDPASFLIRNNGEPALLLGVVMLVGFLSMGWRAGIVVAAAVPLTLAAVFVVMAATGKNFDRITLGSLIMALGPLVDDAIIVIEMMVVKMEEGYDRIRAAACAWSHTAAPMLAGTLVTAIGFMPNGFAKSTAGEHAGNMFWIVGIALIVS